jgi:hypothetical protein
LVISILINWLSDIVYKILNGDTMNTKRIVIAVILLALLSGGYGASQNTFVKAKWKTITANFKSSSKALKKNIASSLGQTSLSYVADFIKVGIADNSLSSLGLMGSPVYISGFYVNSSGRVGMAGFDSTSKFDKIAGTYCISRGGEMLDSHSDFAVRAGRCP